MRPRPLRYVLVTDGSSDQCLLHPIRWLLGMEGWHEVEEQWADLRQSQISGTALAERLRAALEHFPSELIFVHGDAEAEPWERRFAKIQSAIAAVGCTVPHVCIVPVRMTETWLLHDQAAIRRTAGRPGGEAKLEIPAVKRLEQLPDPKSVLRQALLDASEASGGRLRRKRKDFGVMRQLVAKHITDYAPLRGLEAFSRFEHDLKQTLERL